MRLYYQNRKFKFRDENPPENRMLAIINTETMQKFSKKTPIFQVNLTTDVDRHIKRSLLGAKMKIELFI